ncbi:poly-gamma-glutamate synthase PgsB [Prosthecomicrobium sp. N25]|uniref:poly-gamma-glutamate synthase PgsB n=1 Tax=Prosthecomicrobium sp. N25 TaxID=3129254 RepID=UPI003076DCBD
MLSILTDPVLAERLPAPRLALLAVLCFLAAALWLAVAGFLLRRNRARIPVVIHVAGTRGKSTTVRLIAAGLRAGGLRVVGKATGSEPRLLTPDGREEPFRRRGPASIREQARLLARAAREGADALVVECMAIRPDLLWASEARLLKATTLVVTNARPDHFEELGEAPGAMAEALAWLIPQGGTVVAAREAATDGFRARAASLGARLVTVETDGLAPDAANRALALAACRIHGVGEEAAAAGMAFALPDPGHFAAWEAQIEGKTIRFANAFACNDVVSLEALWAERPPEGRPVVVLNARRDRPLRSRHFVRFLAARRPLPLLFVAGDGLAAVLARRAGFGAGDVVGLPPDPRRALAALAAAVPPGTTVWGVGNYAGLGRELAALLGPEPPAC